MINGNSSTGVDSPSRRRFKKEQLKSLKHSIKSRDGLGDSHEFTGAVGDLTLSSDQIADYAKLHVHYSKSRVADDAAITYEDVLLHKSYDATCQLLNPSMTWRPFNSNDALHTNEPAPQTDGPPIDRIGSHFHHGASVVSMQHASKIAKELSFAAPKDLPRRQQNNQQQSRSSSPANSPERRRREPFENRFASPTGSGAEDKRWEVDSGSPIANSPDARRNRERAIRGFRGSELRAMSPPPGSKKNRGSIEHAFDDWEPEPMKDANASPTVRAPRSNVRTSIENYMKQVNLLMQHGVPSAAGAGQRLPIPSFPREWKGRIEEKIHFANEPGSAQFKELLSDEWERVRAEFTTANAKACVNYNLLSANECHQAQIMPKHLQLPAQAWVDHHYRTQEWRILRQTGVRSSVWKVAFQHLTRNLHVYDPVVQQIRRLWLETGLPQSWWDTHAFYQPKSSYSDICFADCSSVSHSNGAAVTINEFIAHVEKCAADIREALTEHWLSTTAQLLVEAFQQSRAQLQAQPQPQPQPPSHQQAPHQTFQEPASHRTSFASASSSMGQQPTAHLGTPSPHELLRNRMVLEGLLPAAPGNTGDSTITQDASVSYQMQLTSAASIVVSSQLRSCCEQSIRAIARYFFTIEDSSHDDFITHGSVLALQLRIRNARGEVITESIDGPCSIVLHPNPHELKEKLSSCIRNVVTAARDVPRLNGLLAKAGFTMQSNLKYLNECAMSMAEPLVVATTEQLHSVVDMCYAEPAMMLETLSDFGELLSGQIQERVDALLEQRADQQLEDQLGQLSAIATRLEAIVDDIQTRVPDVQFFPLFAVRATECKDGLRQYATGLLNRIVDAVAEDNRRQMVTMNAQYQEMANSLLEEATDASELKALQRLSLRCAESSKVLYDQYFTEVFTRVTFLQQHRHKLSREDSLLLYNTYYWPSSMNAFLKRSSEAHTLRKGELEELLEEDQRSLEAELSELARRVEVIAENHVAGEFRKNNERLAAIRRELEDKQSRGEEIEEREQLLGTTPSYVLKTVANIQAALDPIEKLWSITKDFVEATILWQESNVLSIKPEEVERNTEELRITLIKTIKQFEKMEDSRAVAKKLADHLLHQIEQFSADVMPLLSLVSNPGMKQRHWAEIAQAAGVQLPKSDVYSMNMLLELGLNSKISAIEDICVAANKEYTIEKALDKMVEEWEPVAFTTKPYRDTGTQILHSIDDIQQQLDDHIVKTQAMRGSRYIKPYLERITSWESSLQHVQDIIDNWLRVQATWLHLEPIFGSDDIMRQMPSEGKMFRAVDNTWRESMAQVEMEPSVMAATQRAGLLDGLIEANRKLDHIQRGLNDYLDTKRLAFPRFFFLSDDELLEILAETKDPLRVQPHLKKCFDGMAALEFQDNLDITGCFDPIGERVNFPYDAVMHSTINPSAFGGNVERWLVEVEAMMKKSVAFVIDCAIANLAEVDRASWLEQWQGQAILCVNQVSWCASVEKAIQAGENELQRFSDLLCEELNRTVEIVRGDISKRLRVALGALVVMDVHNRDTTASLVADQIQDIGSFEWVAQLRYYWNAGGQSATTGKPGSITCKMLNAVQLYAFEYLGNNGRLVITPLTDRCYRTLMGALHLNLGGAPEGPAGTGKTETVKDLGKAIAIQCVVTNCSDGLDYLAMAKFFKGLASAGAWACFDEFNRIQLEVLSVIAQQILQIQQAKMRQLETFTFEGTVLALNPTCCPFITMNPGYAGRAELPDNLKVLFRTVAMMVPDYTMIAEIMLYSYGYNNARPLATKIVTTYKLCSEQLSSQSHYDYGMRAVMAVLRAAGNLKRSEADVAEDILVLRSIIDVNLPKFLSPDVPLFQGIVSDLFPGLQILPPNRQAMQDAFQSACKHHGLQPTEYAWEKVVQLYDMMLVRHGFMIVGAPFAGKSSAWKLLANILSSLHAQFPEDPEWSNVLPIVMNPKSITMGQLYGMFDLVSHEWTDGILAIQFRNAASNKVGRPDDRKWMLFDGPVDALWIENMNTVLDDNKKLCLTSGEIIAMSEQMSMIFEPMDLKVASPATVSRCGMIYLEPEQLGWQVLVTSWVDRHLAPTPTNDNDGQHERQHDSVLIASDREHIQLLFDAFMDPCLAFVRRELTELSPTFDASLVSSCLNLFEILLQEAASQSKLAQLPGDGVASEAALSSEQSAQRMQLLEACFFFALLWSVGKSGDDASQRKFCGFVESVVEDLSCIHQQYPAVWNTLQTRQWHQPASTGFQFRGITSTGTGKQSLLDVAFRPQENRWASWESLLPPNEQIVTNVPFNSIIVSNVYTVQYQFLLERLIKKRKHVLVCAPTGTGKSTYIYEIAAKRMPQDECKYIGVGFSAKTSANMTQDIIHGKLDKRRKGVYGPPFGQTVLLFVDDLNMPEVEVYGAQPPIELLRQIVDNGGYYDLTEKDWCQVVDLLLIGAMGPAGGGRNNISPRLLRHFHLLCFGDFDDYNLKRIFGTIVTAHFSQPAFNMEVSSLATSLVEAVLETYRSAVRELLPTPRKSHYVFNLRDFSRVVQGILMLAPRADVQRNTVIRLWAHESIRVFGDRLVDDEDRAWFHGQLVETCMRRLHVQMYNVFQHLDVDNAGTITAQDMRNLFFTDFANANREYIEVEQRDALQETVEQSLKDYNLQNKSRMNLVLFTFAFEHISRISRLLRMPGGHALLIGVGGSGRQSLTRLAAFMAGYKIFQIEISKNYGAAEWREDLKVVLKDAGTGAQPLVFLFSDTQIKSESFVEDINNILNSGEVPNLFTADERVALYEAVRPFARQVFGKVAQDMTANELYAFFLKRVKQNLHVVLAFSPVGDAFRDRLRKYPSLINCCAIDWFTGWPQDALIAVAEKFLADVEFESEGLRRDVISMCGEFHANTVELSQSFLEQQHRHTYVTPTSYLELISLLTSSLNRRRGEISQAKQRYETGLTKLAFAAEQVNEMQKQLQDLQPVLAQSQKDTEALMVQVQEKLPTVEQTRHEVQADTAVAQQEADLCQAQKDEVQADLAEAIPALDAAIAALDTLRPQDINEVRSLTKPPQRVRVVCEAVCVMKAIAAQRIPDPENPSKRIMDFWGPSQKMLADPNFLSSLKTYDRDNIPPKIIQEIQERFISDPEFTVENAAKASKAAEGLCKWVHAMVVYDVVAKQVAPKREALAVAEAALEKTLAALAIKQAQLQQVEDELEKLQSQLADAQKRKVDLEDETDLCGKKIVRARQLIDGLGGETERWTEYVSNLTAEYTTTTGDVLVSVAVLAYLGPFTAAFRQAQSLRWVDAVHKRDIPCSAEPSLKECLGNTVEMQQWVIDGLPPDTFSIENGIIIANARRWPLMIDPQGQANRWIRNKERAHDLHIIKLSQPDYLRTLENAVQFGIPVLLDNVGQELDPSLEPILLKQTFRQGGVECIRLGDKTIEFSAQFRFYMTTKLPNPHYLPEVSVKVTLVNFMITPEGLQDQLLSTVVAEERPDLEAQKSRLILESAQNERMLQEIEDNILSILSSSEGNILEDETAISTLRDSKTLADDIKQKQQVAAQTEKDIDLVRQSYVPISRVGQVLFFCIASLASIEPVYQYSLAWFVSIFVQSIRGSDKTDDHAARLENLHHYLVSLLYRRICRSLLEKDKIVFSFLMCCQLQSAGGYINHDLWHFLLTGGSGSTNTQEGEENEDFDEIKKPEWVGDKQWAEVARLTKYPHFFSFASQLAEFETDWKAVSNSSEPHIQAFPGTLASCSPFERLCVLRCIRPGSLVLGIQTFVHDTMGEEFVTPPAFDLAACFAESTPKVPLIFVLSPGSDPMSEIFKLGEESQTQVIPISLGQGQGPVADKLISQAREHGQWVVLQNCHLAPSYMNRLEQICEELEADTNCHANFRLWCTTYPSADFPVSVLQNGVKMTNEPPKGLRSNLLRSFSTDPISDDSFFFSCGSNGPAFRKLLFGLTLFHAIIQERRLYGPLGWNIPYEFNESDLRISAQQLQIFVDGATEISYTALRYTAGECNYGGRVTDDKDRRTLNVILNRFYNPSMLGEGHAFADGDIYRMPEDGDREAFINHIDAFPSSTPPSLLGFHDNADLTRNQNDSARIINSVLLTEKGGASGAGHAIAENSIDTIANGILTQLPPPFDMEAAQLKYPVKWEESMNTVLCQELIRFNNLLETIRTSLTEVQKACRGLVVMSADLEALGTSLYYNQIPDAWRSSSYPSLKQLSGYVGDLLSRLNFFQQWMKTSAPPTFWMSGFFFVQAFLTGAAQNFARKYTIPIDEVLFEHDILPKEQYDDAPQDGVYVFGLFLEGARWNREVASLADSTPKVLHTPAPLIWFRPVRHGTEPAARFERYECPVYKTSERRGVLSTTGHSTNFVCMVLLPSVASPNYWIQRGVAMLTQLDD